MSDDHLVESNLRSMLINGRWEIEMAFAKTGRSRLERARLGSLLNHNGPSDRQRPYDPYRSPAEDVATITGTIGRLYSMHGLSPPFELVRAAEGWMGIPLDRIVQTVEDHLDRYREVYHGSGDRLFHLVQRDVEKLRGVEHGIRGGAADPLPSTQLPPPRSRGIYGPGGFGEAVDYDGITEVSKPGAEQPRIDRQRELVDWEGIDDDTEDRD